MHDSKENFSIRLDDKELKVLRIIQKDESVVFIVDMNGKQLKLYKDEYDLWAGDGDQQLIKYIGEAIEKA